MVVLTPRARRPTGHSVGMSFHAVEMSQPASSPACVSSRQSRDPKVTLDAGNRASHQAASSLAKKATAPATSSQVAIGGVGVRTRRATNTV